MTSFDQNHKATATPTTPEKTGGFGTKQDHTARGATDPNKAEALHAEIKKTWGRLSDEEIKLYETQPDKFFGKVKEKYGFGREDAQKKLAEIKASCHACSENAA